MILAHIFITNHDRFTGQARQTQKIKNILFSDAQGHLKITEIFS